jgi:Mrp family chromosome partitioning ATPase
MRTSKTNQMFEQQMDLLKHRIQLALGNQGSETMSIALTSVSHGEGVTSVASGLASNLARDPRGSVLLIDPDSRVLDRKSRRYARASLRDSTKVTPEDSQSSWTCLQAMRNMTLMTRLFGNITKETGSYTNTLPKTVERARGNYQWTIVSCPPVSEMYESMGFFEKVDGTVLVVEAGKTRFEIIEQTLKVLQESGANVLGAVLNKRGFPIPQWIYRML